MNLMTHKSDTKFYLLVAPLFQSCLHHHQQTLHAENKNILIFCFCLEYLLSTSCHQYCRKLSCPFTQEKDFKFHHKYSLFRVLFNLHFKKLQIEIIAEKLWNSWSIYNDPQCWVNFVLFIIILDLHVYIFTCDNINWWISINFKRNLMLKPIFFVNMGQIFTKKIGRALTYPKPLAWLREGDMCSPDVSCAVPWWGQGQFSLRVEPYRVHRPLVAQILQCTLLGLYRPDSGWVVYKSNLKNCNIFTAPCHFMSIQV